MPYVFELNGRTAIVEDGEVRRLTDRLVRATRRDVWARAGGPDSMFEHYHRIWAHHRNCHSVNLFVLVMEGLGNATLPADGIVNWLKREQTRLAGLLRPRTIHQFFQRLPVFMRKQSIFVRLMKTYMARMRIGAGRTARMLEIVRDSSFNSLSLMATLLTGPAAGAARLAAATGGRALVQDAAVGFLISTIQSSATGLGRLMAGDRVTFNDAVDSTLDDALSAVSGAALGRIFSRFLTPMTSRLTDSAVRAIARGHLAREVGSSLTNAQVEAAVGDAINRMLNNNPGDMRRMLMGSRRERNDRGHANSIATQLAQDRKYLRLLEESLARGR